MLDRVSIELTNRCTKGCWFCYNHSLPGGGTSWTGDELIAFVANLAEGGVRAVSFGGGEPLQFDGWADVFERTRGRLFRSMTTNGLLLDAAAMDRLAAVAIDKVHVSIHFPDRPTEVRRVIAQVQGLSARGIRSGVNLLVSRPTLAAAADAARQLHDGGIDNERIVYLPMRGRDTPTPAELATVAGGRPFQSMTCLGGCARSPRFCSVAWDRSVAWCSYTTARRPLTAATHAGLMSALDGLGLTFCGGTDA